MHMIYLISPKSFATAPDEATAQLYISAGFTVVEREVYLEHVERLAEPPRPAPGADSCPRFDDHSFNG